MSLRHPNMLFIDGRWVLPQAGGRIEVIAPHTEEVVAVVAEAREPDMERAVSAARTAFDGGSWTKLSPPETPIEAYIIAECAEDAGFPRGVLNLVPAHREASDYLVRNPGVDKVSFTGSTLACKRIASVCGERIARVTLELDGKSAAVVLDDADVGGTAKHLAFVISVMSGQVCATLSRVIVPKARYADYTEALRTELSAIKIGDPFDSTSGMGPLAMRRQLTRVESYIAKGAGRARCMRRRPPQGSATRLLFRTNFVHPSRQRHEHRSGRDFWASHRLAGSGR